MAFNPFFENGNHQRKYSFWQAFFGKVKNKDIAEVAIQQSAKGFLILATVQGIIGIILFRAGGYALVVDAVVFATLAIILIVYYSRVAAFVLLILSVIILFTTITNLFNDGVFGGGTNLVLAIIVMFLSIRAAEGALVYSK